MPNVFVPPSLRDLTDGLAEVDVAGGTVAEVIEALDERFPGTAGRLRQGDALKAGLAVVVDGEASAMGLLQKVGPGAEVHFLPAIGGG